MMQDFKRKRTKQLRGSSTKTCLPEQIRTIDLKGTKSAGLCSGCVAKKRANEALSKDPEMIRWLDEIGPDDLLWDIGANVGIYSLYAALRQCCRVYAFEPGAANYYILNRNIELNRAHDNIMALCIAVAEKTEFDVLNMRRTVPGYSLSTFGQAVGERGQPFVPSFKQGMISFSLDDLATHLPAPTHIKIDVDGIDLQIFSVARRC